MITKKFLDTLKNNLNKELLFEYAPDKFVNANYHITEIKNLSIDTVDCGGRTNQWEETIVQIWENPLEKGKRTYMKTSKAVEIFDRVNSIKPLLTDAEIKIEFGNKTFHTANLIVHTIAENNQSIIVKLHPDATQCKANNICCAPDKKGAIIGGEFLKEEKSVSCC